MCYRPCARAPTSSEAPSKRGRSLLLPWADEDSSCGTASSARDGRIQQRFELQAAQGRFRLPGAPHSGLLHMLPGVAVVREIAIVGCPSIVLGFYAFLCLVSYCGYVGGHLLRYEQQNNPERGRAPLGGVGVNEEGQRGAGPGGPPAGPERCLWAWRRGCGRRALACH